jgi:hypothetical protein
MSEFPAPPRAGYTLMVYPECHGRVRPAIVIVTSMFE